MTDLTQVQFDYGQIAEQHRDEVKGAAMRIKVRMARTAEDIVEIGRDLLAAKERVGHGNWLAWLDAEFGMSSDTAQRFINVADKLGDQIPQIAEFTPSALYELAAPSTNGEVVDVALDQAEQGNPPTHKKIKELKRQLQEQKEKASEENSKAKAAHQEFERLQSEVDKLRDQKDTLERELQRTRHQPSGQQQKRAAADEDRDLSEEAADQVARVLSEYVPGEHWDGVKANLHKCRGKQVAQAMDRLTGVAVFDNTRGGEAA
jgi:chromosome segregation ATPase